MIGDLVFDGLEIIENKYLPENVVLTADRNFFYWLNKDTGEIKKIPKTDIFNFSEFNFIDPPKADFNGYLEKLRLEILNSMVQKPKGI